MKKLIIILVIIFADFLYAAGTYTTDNLTAVKTVTAEQVTSTDDMTMQGHLLTLGNNTSAADVVIDFLSSGSDGNMTYDQSEDLFDFDDSDIITLATMTAEHLYSTDDLQVDDDGTINDDLTVLGRALLGGITYNEDEVTNGDFATDSDWSMDPGWTISDGTAKATGFIGATAKLQQNMGLVIGRKYKVRCDVVLNSHDAIVSLVIDSDGVLALSAVGSYSVDYTATSTTGNIRFSIGNFSSGQIFEIDNVSVIDNVNLHVIGTTANLNPVHVSDSSDNLLIEGDLEVQGNEYIEGALDVDGNITTAGTVDGVDVAALKTDVDGFPDDLKNVTASATELNYLDGSTPGTAVASKALVVDASKDIDLGTGDLTATIITDGTLSISNGAITSAVAGTFSGAVTFTVAANDSLHKNNSDYVCDGTDDQVQIQAAIDAMYANETVGSRGGVVQLSQGLFWISDTIQIYGGMIFQGSGMGQSSNELCSTIRLAANSDCVMMNIGSYPGSAHFFTTLRDFVLDGNKDNQASPTGAYHGITITNPASDVSMRDMFMVNIAGDGVYCETNWNIFIIRLWIEEIGRSAIHVVNGDRVSLQDVFMFGCEQAAFHLTRNTRNVLANNLSFRKNEQEAILISDSSTYNPHDLVFNNLIIDNSSWGDTGNHPSIRISTSNVVNRTTFNNVIFKSEAEGYSSYDIVLEEGAQGAGVLPDYVYFQNTILDPDSGGVSIEAGANTHGAIQADANFATTGTIQAGLTTITNTGTQLILEYDDVNQVAFTVDANGDMGITTYGLDWRFSGPTDITTGGAVTAEQLTSTDDMTMQGHLLTLGNYEDAADVVIDFLTSGNTGKITFDQTDKEFDFDDNKITTSAKVTAESLAVVDADISGDVDIVGDVNVVNIVITTPTESDIKIGGRGARSMYFEGQAANNAMGIQMFTKTGDATKSCTWEIFGLGTEAAASDYEKMFLGYHSGLTSMLCASFAGAGETVRPLVIYTGSNTNQLKLEIDGNVVMATLPVGTGTTLELNGSNQIVRNTSSIVYKKNIKDLDNTERIYNLRPISYDSINGKDTNLIGLIAEEVVEIMPELICYKHNKITETIEDEYVGTMENIIGYEKTDIPESVNYSRLIVPMLKEIQELKKRIEILENK